ncbi:HAD family hydrolase, partial [Rhizobium ruizarguesonis]
VVDAGLSRDLVQPLVARSSGFIDLVFLGLAGLQDPVRPEVPKAMKDCHAAGVEVVMVTGDDPRTAAAIARDAGLGFHAGQVVSGHDIDE